MQIQSFLRMPLSTNFSSFNPCTFLLYKRLKKTQKYPHIQLFSCWIGFLSVIMDETSQSSMNWVMSPLKSIYVAKGSKYNIVSSLFIIETKWVPGWLALDKLHIIVKRLSFLKLSGILLLENIPTGSLQSKRLSNPLRNMLLVEAFSSFWCWELRWVDNDVPGKWDYITLRLN